MKDFIVWMSFEANVTIRANTDDEALEKAHRMLDDRSVYVDKDYEKIDGPEQPKYDGDFQAQEPHIVEEHDVKEES